MFSALIGCGNGSQPTGTVQGDITYEGKPVSDASIQFLSSEKGSATALVMNGSFKIDVPLAVGQYKISITPYENVPPAGTVKVLPLPKVRDDIPLKYRDAAKSGLTLDVITGVNTFSANLTGK